MVPAENVACATRIRVIEPPGIIMPGIPADTLMVGEAAATIQGTVVCASGGTPPPPACPGNATEVLNAAVRIVDVAVANKNSTCPEISQTPGVSAPVVICAA